MPNLTNSLQAFSIIVLCFNFFIAIIIALNYFTLLLLDFVSPQTWDEFRERRNPAWLTFLALKIVSASLWKMTICWNKKGNE